MYLSKPTAMELCIFPAHGSLHCGFGVCQTLGYNSSPTISVQEEKKTPLLTVLLCGCSLSVAVSSPCDPVGGDGYCYYFHFMGGNAEAQRLACSMQLVNDRAGLVARSSNARPPRGSLLGKVADVPIGHSRQKRMKGNGRTVHEACSSRQVLSQRNFTFWAFKSNLLFLFSYLPPSYSAHTPGPPPPVTVFLRKSQRSSRSPWRVHIAQDSAYP